MSSANYEWHQGAFGVLSVCDTVGGSLGGGVVPRPAVDAVVVGAGPAGSVAAIVLARGGARVTLVDKASFARDKACGDLVGPRAVALLGELGLVPPSSRQVGEMIVIGPTGAQVLLPARAGRTYPDHGLVVPRLRFDAWLREAALASGAEAVTARVMGLCDGGVQLDNGSKLLADIVIGADGATSGVGLAAGLVHADAVLWGFAQRTYVAQDVDRPIIALWDEHKRRGFPGYGWLFPGEDGAANIGLGLGLRADRRSASRAVAQLDAFAEHLRRLGVLTAALDGRRLGGLAEDGNGRHGGRTRVGIAGRRRSRIGKSATG
jgi:flavin-dependent dehydrogenase